MCVHPITSSILCLLLGAVTYELLHYGHDSVNTHGVPPCRPKEHDHILINKNKIYMTSKWWFWPAIHVLVNNFQMSLSLPQRSGTSSASGTGSTPRAREQTEQQRRVTGRRPGRIGLSTSRARVHWLAWGRPWCSTVGVPPMGRRPVGSCMSFASKHLTRHRRYTNAVLIYLSYLWH